MYRRQIRVPQLPRGWYHLLLYRWKERKVQAVSVLINLLDRLEITLSPPFSQLASLSAKVQAYEDVIRKLSGRFGVSDEQLVNIALAAVSYDFSTHSFMSKIH